PGGSGSALSTPSPRNMLSPSSRPSPRPSPRGGLPSPSPRGLSSPSPRSVHSPSPRAYGRTGLALPSPPAHPPSGPSPHPSSSGNPPHPSASAWPPRSRSSSPCPRLPNSPLHPRGSAAAAASHPPAAPSCLGVPGTSASAGTSASVSAHASASASVSAHASASASDRERGDGGEGQGELGKCGTIVHALPGANAGQHTPPPVDPVDPAEPVSSINPDSKKGDSSILATCQPQLQQQQQQQQQWEEQVAEELQDGRGGQQQQQQQQMPQMPQMPQRIVQQILPSAADLEPVLPAYSSQSLWGFVAEIDGPDAFAGGVGTEEDDAASGGGFQESLSMTAGQGQTAASLDMHDIEQLLMGDECAADMSGCDWPSSVGNPGLGGIGPGGTTEVGGVGGIQDHGGVTEAAVGVTDGAIATPLGETSTDGDVADVSAVGHLLFDDSSAMQQLSADWLTDFQRSNYAAFTPDTGAALVPGAPAAAQQAALSSAEHAAGMPSSGGPSVPVQQGVWQLGAAKGRQPSQDGSGAGGEYHWGLGFVP
ncbi:unnamed protein product, partial [Closterium sp. Naga37s-1]